MFTAVQSVESRINCIARSRSSALFIIPRHEITILSVYILFKNCRISCLMHECQMRGTILCPGRYESRLIVLIRPPPITWLVYDEHHPLPLSLLRSWLAYLNWVLSNNSLVPWIAVARAWDSWLVLTYHHHHQLQHLPSSTTLKKELACSYFRLSLSSFWLDPLAA